MSRYERDEYRYLPQVYREQPPVPFTVRAAERLFNNRKFRRRGALVLTVALAGGVILDKGDTAEDNCTNVRQQQVQVGAGDRWFMTDKMQAAKNMARAAIDAVPFVDIDNNRSISDIAASLTDSRHYYVSPEQLAALNEKILKRDNNGEVNDTMPLPSSESGTYCLKVPGPVYAGQDVVEEKGETLKTIAQQEDMNVTLLRRFNPHLARKKDDDALALGTVLRTDEVIDTNFVYRKMTNSEGNINGMGDAQMRARIINVNYALINSGETPDSPDDTGYFPILDASDQSGIEHYSATDIKKAYTPNAKPINVDNTQIDQKGKDSDKKPVQPKTPPKKKTPPAGEGRAINDIEVGPTVGHTVKGAPVPRTIGRVIYYSQADTRWAYDQYEYKNNNRTIYTSGCGPTSLAMVISTLSSDKNVRPDEMARLTKKLGYRGAKGTEHGAFLTIPRRYGLKSHEISLRMSAIRAALKRGSLVIINGQDKIKSTPATDSGHVYVIQGVTSKGQLVVADPNEGGVKKSLRTWDPDSIINPATGAYEVSR